MGRRVKRAGRNSFRRLARLNFRGMAVTVSVTAAPSPTGFDYALCAAVRCGWPPEAAFHAVCAMMGHGLTAAAVEELFRDAGRRLQ